MNRALYVLVVRAILSLAFILAYGYIVGYFLSLDSDISETQERILTLLLGVLTTSVVTVVNYWFSSSQGSADKQADISERR